MWVAFLELLDVSPYVGKGPLDVYRYLFVGEDAAADRAEVLGLLGTTLGDAALGFVAGMVAAVVLACLVVLSRGVAGTRHARGHARALGAAHRHDAGAVDGRSAGARSPSP